MATTLIDLKCTETIVPIAGKSGDELILVILRITVMVRVAKIKNRQCQNYDLIIQLIQGHAQYKEHVSHINLCNQFYLKCFASIKHLRILRGLINSQQ